MNHIEIIDLYQTGNLSKYQQKLIDLIIFTIKTNNLYALGKLEIIYSNYCRAAQIIITGGL